LKEFAESVAKRISFKEVSPEEFISQRGKTTRPGFLSPLEAEELGQHNLLTTRMGRIRAPVDPQGEDDNPDVVFMKWNGYPTGGEKAALGRAWDRTRKAGSRWSGRK
jgi:hypothetical protein